MGGGYYWLAVYIMAADGGRDAEKRKLEIPIKPLFRNLYMHSGLFSPPFLT